MIRGVFHLYEKNSENFLLSGTVQCFLCWEARNCTFFWKEHGSGDEANGSVTFRSFW